MGSRFDRPSLRRVLIEYRSIGWPPPEPLVDELASRFNTTREIALFQFTILEDLLTQASAYLGRPIISDDDARALIGRVESDFVLSPGEADRLHPGHLQILLAHRARRVALPSLYAASDPNSLYSYMLENDIFIDSDCESTRIFRFAYGMMLERCHPGWLTGPEKSRKAETAKIPTSLEPELPPEDACKAAPPTGDFAELTSLARKQKPQSGYLIAFLKFMEGREIASYREVGEAVYGDDDPSPDRIRGLVKRARAFLLDNRKPINFKCGSENVIKEVSR